MGKCNHCGRKGLFFRVNKEGLCKNCVIEINQQAQLAEIEARLSDSAALLREAMDAARTEAQQRLVIEEVQLRTSCEALRAEMLNVTAERDALIVSNEKAAKELESMVKRTEKLKPLANSIKHAHAAWVEGTMSDEALAEFAGMPINDLLPEPALNCLSMKQLKSRYTSLRKQTIDLCTSYESRYTTKTNAALYKLMVLALEAELENILHKLQFGKLETGVSAVRELASKYYAIAADGNQSIAPTLKRFVGELEALYLQIVETEYEYYVQRERAREEQRALKEKMREEAEDRKRLEQEKKKVEAEEKKYQQELDRITELMQQAHDAELEKLRKRLEEVNGLMANVETKKADIVKLQNGKAGTVYVISNIGSFGETVFKVGMTRRQEAQERIDELNNASVPFPFDVHSTIFSEDAPALENELHKLLNDRRVNKVNLRKEFFNIPVEELRQLVEKVDPTAEFHVTAAAEQYRQSQSITDVPFETVVDDEDIA